MAAAAPPVDYAKLLTSAINDNYTTGGFGGTSTAVLRRGGYATTIYKGVPELEAPQSFTDIIDSFLFNWVMSALSFAGIIILMNALSKSVLFGIWEQVFYIVGFVAALLQLAVFFAIPITFAIYQTRYFNRASQPGVGAVSILASLVMVAFGVISLILAFGEVVATSMPNQAETFGYIAVFLGTLYAGAEIGIHISQLFGAGAAKGSDIFGQLGNASAAALLSAYTAPASGVSGAGYAPGALGDIGIASSIAAALSGEGGTSGGGGAPGMQPGGVGYPGGGYGCMPQPMFIPYPMMGGGYPCAPQTGANPCMTPVVPG